MSFRPLILVLYVFIILGLKMEIGSFRNASPNVLELIDFNILTYGEVLSFITPEIRKNLRNIEKLLKKKRV